jgi:polysaccharide export outer membrane protein
VRNKDAIYISNSRTVEAQKLMEHIRILNATIKEPVDTAISVYTLKSLIKGTATSVFVGTTTGP